MGTMSAGSGIAVFGMQEPSNGHALSGVFERDDSGVYSAYVAGLPVYVQGPTRIAPCSPDVVQYGPNTGQSRGAGQTKDQHETTRFTTPLNLQNLHPRFKSGRRLQNP